MNNCQSCGMPMDKPEDFGGGRPGNSYCRHCTDDQGDLLPRDVVREKMIKFQRQSLGKTEEQAGADVDKHLALMPAWKLGVGGEKPAFSGPPPSQTQVPPEPSPRPEPVFESKPFSPGAPPPQPVEPQAEPEASAPEGLGAPLSPGVPKVSPPSEPSVSPDGLGSKPDLGVKMTPTEPDQPPGDKSSWPKK